MAEEKRYTNLTVRIDEEFLDRLKRLEAHTLLGRSEITRQALEAVLKCFETEGQIKFPVFVANIDVPKMTEEILTQALEKHRQQQEKARFYDRHTEQIYRLFNFPTPEFLKQLDDFRNSAEYPTEAPPDYDDISIVHNGTRFYPYSKPVEMAIEAGTPPPSTFRYDLVLLLKDVQAEVTGVPRVARVFGRGMHPLIPFGGTILIEEWPYTDLPQQDTIVIYRASHRGRGAFKIGTLHKRQALPDEKSDSKGEVTVARLSHDAFPEEDVISPGAVVGVFRKLLEYPVLVDIPSIGDGLGYGDGSGSGYGDGSGFGYGDGSGDGQGHGDGSGNG